ncbi:hypothetical protein DKP76_11260 [Falsochrobactrum shanghaiense]|uniref:DUF2207 domain-containing protein n=1 Tax=Falsochrobactrum shanghaiense TaxID=2201899 RepID=A0A316JE19_9HYPH|nr:hypothetical protein [Falsochrobactrum shanghaiense]PWL17353.1 hypothetical protein DKP76_11260 [Falsochrobactrum shanghaiense]
MVETKKSGNAALAAFIILLGFGVLGYFVPTIMLALGGYSQVLAIIFPIIFVLGFFAIFWLRARSQKKRD